MMAIRIFVLFFVLLLASASSLYKQKTTLESNHFSSEDKREAAFKLSNVQSLKPLILILKKKSQSQYDIATNPISVSLLSSNQTASCEFKSYNDLCVIPKVEDVNINITVSCEKAPCEVSWTIYQLRIDNLGLDKLSAGLFTLQKSADHLITVITCSDPSIKNFAEDISVYSESHYERGGTAKEIYFLFNNEEKGYIFIDIKQRSKKCAHLSIVNIPKKIDYSQTTIRDFANKDSASEFRLNMPKFDIRLQGQFNRLNVVRNHKFLTTVSLLGVLNKTQQVLLSKNLIRPTNNDRQIKFSITFKQPKQQYEELILRIENRNEEMTVVAFMINQYSVQDVELGDRNYFDLKAGEVIKYRLESQLLNAGDEDQVYFNLQPKANLSLSVENCSMKKGCEFELQALSDTESYIYISSKPLGEEQGEKPQFFPIVKVVSKKIRDNVNIYLQKHVKAGKAFEVMVNNPNVLIYASSEEKCQVPNEECYERIGNYHNPFVYNPVKDGLFRLNVQGLESGEFMLAIVDQDDEFIPLEDGMAFSYTLDQTQNQILFKYKLKEQKDLNFNLVAPLNSVVLKVTNNKGFTEDGDVEVSSQGFLVISKTDMIGTDFAIKVQKTAVSQNKRTHFTIIVSTGDVPIRLQNTVTHYQTLPSQAYREYVFEYSPNEQYIINFYSPDLKEKNLTGSIEIYFANKRVWNSSNGDQMNKYIEKEVYFLDLKQVPSKLCNIKEADSCQIFMKLSNQYQETIDVGITLMVRDSIIELKDGIWQSYSESTIASSAYFYFYPKHYNKDVIIIYSNTENNLRILYTLVKTDSKSINPEEWPFPERPLVNNGYRPLNNILIQKEILKSQCQPNCVVLITLYRIDQQNFVKDQGDFSILASNNQIQLPENTRVDFSLKKDEEKQVLIDLKQILKSNFCTFYSSQTLGSYNILANVYSHRVPRCPVKGEPFDFLIQNGETDIVLGQLKAKINQLHLNEDENVYLCLSICAFQNSKLSLQYTTKVDNSAYKKIHLDSFEQIELKAGDKKIYQIDGLVDFNVKILRKKGYPYVLVEKCELPQMKECKSKISKVEEKGKQLVSKTEEFQQAPCAQCVYFFKFEAQEPATIIFYLKSLYSSIELRENQIVTDFIQKGDQNRYQLTSIIGVDLMVNVHVLEGDLQAKLTDEKDFSLVKESSADNKLIHFYIPGQHSKFQNEVLEPKYEKSNRFSMNPFRFSRTFNSFHLVLTKKQNKSCTYSITYSSGKNKVILQDGLITDITLQPKKQASFYYSNEGSTQHIYLTITALNADQFKSLLIKCFYLKDGEQANRTQFNLIKPIVKGRTPKPTLLFSLPAENYFQIELTNMDVNIKAVSIGINHQQVILLPFNHDYPFILHAKEQINILVQVNEPGYIQTMIRKCDQSDPTFSYALNYGSFIKNEFYSKITLNEDPTFEYFIKIDKAGTFYINFKSSPFENSLLSVLLKFYKQKPNKQTFKPGRKGIIDYEIVDTKKAEISFAPIVCSSEKCPKVTYYTINAKKRQDLYSQLVCPSHYFLAVQLTTVAPIIPEQIHYEEGSTNIKYTYNLVDHISFVGVKAVIQNAGEVYYRPVEVVTFWGQLSRTNQSHLITIVIIIVVLIASLMIYVRHSARKGYRPIESDEGPGTSQPSQSAQSSDSSLSQPQNDV